MMKLDFKESAGFYYTEFEGLFIKLNENLSGWEATTTHGIFQAKTKEIACEMAIKRNAEYKKRGLKK